MIPRTHIEFNDDHTEAWVVVEQTDSGWLSGLMGADGPCDTCDGASVLRDEEHDDAGRVVGVVWEHCPDCDGTGRHTFTIDIECPVLTFEGSAIHDHPDVNPCPVCSGVTTYRVSVVPGMVEKQEDGTWRVRLKIH
jgi:DnaJ-class molecular chaperone